MKRSFTLTHEFVEFIPDQLSDRTVYVSIPYATVVHKCCCGCGHEVVTPLSPTDWQLTFDGISVSLNPSVGNWSFPCQSHYWIRKNKVEWSTQMSPKQIEGVRHADRLNKERYFDEADQNQKEANSAATEPAVTRSSTGWWAGIKKRWRFR